MFIRLNVTTIDSHSRRPQGIIHAAYALRNSGGALEYEAQSLQSLIDWFNENVPVPPQKVRDSLDNTAVFWFKQTEATQLILEKAWELAWLLQQHEYEVQVWRTKSLPGFVVWEDEIQAATASLTRKQGRETWASRPLTKDRTP